MVVVNTVKRELTAKVVYYGPGLCGKTSNIQFIYESLDDSQRGKLLSLSTEADRTLFFDFLPIDMGEVKGFKVRIQLYTVPGQVFYEETRKRVLKGADGVVFVADSQRSTWEANLQSFAQMMAHLKDNGIHPDSIPIVLQYNKRDLPEISSVEELDQALNPGNLPFFEATAHQGVGVEDTLRSVTKQVLKNLLARELRGPEKVSQTPVAAPVPAAASSPESTVMMDRKKLLSELGISGSAPKAAKPAKAPVSPPAPAIQAGEDPFETTGESALLGSGDALASLTEGPLAPPAPPSHPLEETDPGVVPRPGVPREEAPLADEQAAEVLFEASQGGPLLLQNEESSGQDLFEEEPPTAARASAPAASEADLAPIDGEAVVLVPGQEFCLPVQVEGKAYLLRLRLERAPD